MDTTITRKVSQGFLTSDEIFLAFWNGLERGIQQGSASFVTLFTDFCFKKIFPNILFIKYLCIVKKTNFMASFYGWGSTASWLEPLRGGSLLFTTKFTEIPRTHSSTSEGRKAESTLQPFGDLEHGTPGLGIQRLCG